MGKVSDSGRRVALVVGVDHYEDDQFNDLTCAISDAARICGFLEHVAWYNRVQFLASNVTSAAVMRAVEDLAKSLGPGDLFVFYFAGHGAEHEGRHLLLCPQAKYVGLRYCQECVPVDYIREITDEHGMDRVFILDACRADLLRGRGQGQRGLRGEAGLRDVVTGAQVRKGSFAILCSCSENEQARELPGLGHGLFTAALLSVLQAGVDSGTEVAVSDALRLDLAKEMGRLCEKCGWAERQNPWNLNAGSATLTLIPGRPVSTVSTRPALTPWTNPLVVPRVKCPLCGMRNDPNETFECRVCGRDYLCPGHFVNDRRCCEECAERRVTQQETSQGKAEQQGKAEAAQRERQAAETAERRSSLSQMIFPMSVDQARQVQAVSVAALGVPVQRTLDCGQGTKLELVWIPPGDFLMGSPRDEAGRGSDQSQHRVKLTQGFYLGKYPVTQAQYEAVVGKNPSLFKGKDRPVEEVSWYDAMAFCEQLSRKVDHQVKLPTEAQWEYACRAGTATPFSFGATISTDQGNYDGNYTYGSGIKGKYRKETTLVDLFRSNAWGLYDMHGNVWEWCVDWYGEGYYSNSPDRNPGGPVSGVYRVLRGGSWFNGPGLCRSASRYGDSPDDAHGNVGFRVVCPSPVE